MMFSQFSTCSLVLIPYDTIPIKGSVATLRAMPTVSFVLLCLLGPQVYMGSLTLENIVSIVV